MDSPFKDIEKAFDTMYDELVTVKSKQGVETSLFANVCTDITDDPDSDSMMDAEHESIALTFRKDDWPFIQSLKRGDKIEVVTYHKKYAIAEVKVDVAMGWIVKAKSV